MKVTRTTGWSLATAGVCLAVALASWFLLVSPQRAAAAEARELTAAAEQQNAELVIRIDQLREEFADLPARQAELAAIRQALPEDAALAQLIRDVESRAEDTRVRLDSITSGAPVALVDPNAAVVAPAEGGETSTEGSGDAAGGTASEAPADASAEPSAAPSEPAADDSAPSGDTGTPAEAPPAVAPVPTGPVLAAVPVVITSTGDFAATTLFLKQLQADMPRALHVDGLQADLLEGEEGSDPGTITVRITGRVFAFVDPTAADLTDLPTDLDSPADLSSPSDG